MKKLSDNDLLERLKTYRGAERAVLLKILGCINEVERRRLYVPRGYASLYEFCMDFLEYSRSAAMRRIHAARCIERFPHVAVLLRSGELTLTVAAMISPILTKENAGEIISYAKGRSTREVEMLVSRHRPKFMLRDRVRPVSLMVPDVIKNDSSQFPGAGKNLNQPIDNKSDKNRALPLDSDNPNFKDMLSTIAGKTTTENVERVLITQKYKLEFAVDPEFMEKLGRIRSLLSTKYPGGMGFEKVFDILMQEFLERHDPEKRIQRRNAQKDHARNRDSASNGNNKQGQEKKVSDHVGKHARKSGEQSRHIPPAIRDEVFARDGGRCTFIGPKGRRCGCRWNLQVDHINPFAKGGRNSPDNLRLLCARHNILEAERIYGGEHMKRFNKRE